MSGSQPDTSSEEEEDNEDAAEDDEDDENDDDDEDEEDDDEDDVKLKSSLSSTEGNTWDELARLINRNLLQAAYANAQLLGIDVQSLRSGTLTYTPRSTSRSIPTALVPVELQYRVAHDPVIDIIPHPRLRHNILCAIANNQINAAALSRCIRGSGAIEQAKGAAGQRTGLVVWSAGEKLESWELSEQFFRQWTILLQGCEDLIAATNAWRSKRGERLFPSVLERGGSKRS
ncbi:hypothetical protein LTR86_005765 [Recurvomyces mirabilis]|nr:hypothetical protein LTR86_005765 [Recurvomyces mirabilis]